MKIKATANDYRNLTSFNNEKFIYLKNEKFKKMLNNIFDNNNIYSEKIDGKFIPLNEILNKRNNLNDFNDYQKTIINQLIDGDLIILYEDSFEISKNKERFNVLHGLISSDYISSCTLTDEVKKFIKKEVSNGNLSYGKNIFAKKEVDFISFILDNKKYSNGLFIRNIIAHGSNSRDTEINYKKDYIEILRLLVIYVFRIQKELVYKVSNI